VLGHLATTVGDPELAPRHRHPHLLADQSPGDRVGIAIDLDAAVRPHPPHQLAALLERRPAGEWLQRCRFVPQEALDRRLAGGAVDPGAVAVRVGIEVGRDSGGGGAGRPYRDPDDPLIVGGVPECRPLDRPSRQWRTEVRLAWRCKRWACSFFRLWATQCRVHSPAQAVSPRTMKRLAPWVSFICPKTGSTVWPRRA
jgi:hypothetical protein